MRKRHARLSFPAWRTEEEFIPLIELLLAVGPWIVGSVTWDVADCEFGTGWRRSQELASLAQSPHRLTTRDLVDLVSDGVQLVNWEACCYDSSEPEAFLVLRSVRGDEWDVLSTQELALESIGRCFGPVTKIPSVN